MGVPKQEPAANWLQVAEATQQVGSNPGATRFGDYELLQEIGHGGMGVVHKARQVSLNRIVALKTLLAGSVEDEIQVKRFHAEAESAAKLQHPNIVEIHETSFHEGKHFFTMDFVEGRSVAQIASRNPLTPRKAAEYLREVARAVDYAHQQGVLHRDLKPSNILIEDATDRPRVTDFGLAKRIEDHSDLTLSGQVVGTASYMPPEQAAGRTMQLGPWSDVYALGATLYEALTGRPPHRGPSTVATLKLVLETEPAPLRLVSPGMPKDLETICLKCLVKEPSRRYQGAGELADDLDRFLQGKPVLARPVGTLERTWLWCRRNPRTATLSTSIILLLLVILMGSPVALVRVKSSRDDALRHAQAEEKQRHRAETNLRRLELERVRSLFAADNAAGALASLAALLRQEHSNTFITEWTVNELTRRNFALPVAGPMVHEDKVHFVEFSRDGRRLLTASRVNEARVWDALSGTLICPPLKHGHWAVEQSQFPAGVYPLFARFSPDGRRVLTGSVDKLAQVWDADTGQPLGTSISHSNCVTGVMFSPDGSLFVTACRDGTVRVWKSDPGEPAGAVLRHAAEVVTVEFSPDGRRLVTASDDRTAQVWDIASGRPVGEPARHSQDVRFATFSPDGSRFATGGADGMVGLWDAATGKALIEPLRHEKQVSMVSFSPSGVWLVTASFDRTARIWNSRTGRPQGKPLAHKSTVRWAEFSPEGERIVTASEDRTARIWDALTGSPLSEPLAHVDAVWCARFSPDGRYVATGCSDGTARLWDALPGAAMRLNLDQGGVVDSVRWLPHTRELIALGRNAEVRDTATGETISSKFGFRQSLTGTAISPDGSRLVTEVEGGILQVWDSRKGRILLREKLHQAAVTGVDFSADGKFVISASIDDTARVWDSRSGATLAGPLLHPDDVLSAAFGPDSKVVATAAKDRKVRIWEVSGGRRVGAEIQLNAGVTRLKFSANGLYLAMGAQDGTAHIWELGANRPLVPPMKHHGPVSSVAFSHDDKWLLIASRDGTARVWDVRTGRPVSDLMRHEGALNGAKFGPGDRHVLTACTDGTACVWDISASQPVWVSPTSVGQVSDASFNQDGTRIAVASAAACQLYDFVPVALPAPAWLADLAEAVAGQRADVERGIEPVAWDQFFQLQALARTKAASHPLSAWLQWFLADRSQRQITPSVELGIGTLLSNWVQAGYHPSLENLNNIRTGLRCSPADGAVQAQVARVMTVSRLPDQSHLVEVVDWSSRRALELAPNHYLSWYARANYFEMMGDLEAAISLMEKGSRYGPSPEYWMEWAFRLERAGRFAQAREIFTKGLESARKSAELGRLKQETVAKIQFYRAQFLLRHGQPAEGVEDLSCALRIPRRESGIPNSLLDLTQYYNCSLVEGAYRPSAGWIPLEGLPLGCQSIEGIHFDIRGLVQLSWAFFASNNPNLPEKISNIPVGQACRRIHFLHAADVAAKADTRLGSYVLHYQDGNTAELPVLYGKTVLAWDAPLAPGKTHPTVAWCGRSNSKLSAHLFLTTWENPRPDMVVQSIDLVPALAASAPFVAAITVD